MEFLKQQWLRISQQLNGLSASQKMLTACLAAIMLMTVVLWSRYAAEPDMTALLNQSMNADEITQISGELDSRQIPYKLSGDRVLVPTERKIEILSVLGYARHLPHDTTKAFDEIVKSIGLFDPPSVTDAKFLEAKQQTLQMIIGQFPGVNNAVVVIDPTSERRLNGTDIEPTATVFMSTANDGKSANKRLAESAADMVCGAVAGLARAHVKVVINGINYALQNQDADDMPGDVVELYRQHEAYYRDKIVTQLGFIHNLMVAVTVKPNTSSVVETDHKVDPKNVVSAPISTETHTEETNSSVGGSSGDAGAGANIGLTVGGGNGGGNSNSTNEDKTNFVNDHGTSDIVKHQGPGDAQVIAASVRVPRSYLISAYRIANNGQDPDPAALKTYTDFELNQVRADVKNCTGLTTDDSVTVGIYSDETPAGGAAIAPQTASSPLSSMLGGHVKEIGLGLLAAISLFMVSSMVRKSALPPVAVAEMSTGGKAKAENHKLMGETEVAGEAGDGNNVLDGVEMDDETVKAQQMLSQVQQLVTENPDAAATLVKRWLNRS